MNQETESPSSSLLWLKVLAGPHSTEILAEGMQKAAESLSAMMGRPIRVGIPRLEAIPVGNLLNYVGDPEVAMVGVYLLIDGALKGQALLLLALRDAFYLVGAATGSAPHTITDLNSAARSAIGAVGHTMLSAFLEVVTDWLDSPVKPSLPAVMVDMAGAIIDVVAATSIVAQSDNLMVIQADFKDADQSMQCRFWVLPDPDRDALC